MKKLLGLLIVIAFIAIPFSHADARHWLPRFKLCHIEPPLLLTPTGIPCRTDEGRRGQLFEVTATGMVQSVALADVLFHYGHGDFPALPGARIGSKCGQIIGFECLSRKF